MGPPPPEMMGPPPAPPAPEGMPPPEELVRAMIELGQQALTAEDDDVDSAALAKVISQLQMILAGRQKEAESATGVSPAAKFMGRGRA